MHVNCLISKIYLDLYYIEQFDYLLYYIWYNYVEKRNKNKLQQNKF